LQRLQGLEGVPSFLLEGVTVEKTGDNTLRLTSEEPLPALPAILATPSCGIVNSKVVQENGGSADTTDTAEDFLNQTSAGSGPYILEKLDQASEAVLVLNTEYNGPQTPTYQKVILRNVKPATQKMNAESPFVPLLQPGSNVAYQPSVGRVYYNPVWLINVAGLTVAN